MADSSPTKLTAEQRTLVSWTLQVARGRYPAWRASQLSGIPRSTLYDWVQNEVYVPDFARPLEWSYRDLIYVRLFAWLRAKGMPRPRVASRVKDVRARLEEGLESHVLRSDGRGVFLGLEDVDTLTGQTGLPSVVSLLEEFRLTAGVERTEFGRRHLWGPNLLTPSERSFISPRVMGGEPCITETRIPTGTLFALRTQRNLDVPAIQELYAELGPRDVEDAVQLESRLRGQRIAA